MLPTRTCLHSVRVGLSSRIESKIDSVQVHNYQIVCCNIGGEQCAWYRERRERLKIDIMQEINMHYDLLGALLSNQLMVSSGRLIYGLFVP